MHTCALSRDPQQTPLKSLSKSQLAPAPPHPAPSPALSAASTPNPMPLVLSIQPHQLPSHVLCGCHLAVRGRCHGQSSKPCWGASYQRSGRAGLHLARGSAGSSGGEWGRMTRREVTPCLQSLGQDVPLRLCGVWGAIDTPHAGSIHVRCVVLSRIANLQQSKFGEVLTPCWGGWGWNDLLAALLHKHIWPLALRLPFFLCLSPTPLTHPSHTNASTLTGLQPPPPSAASQVSLSQLAGPVASLQATAVIGVLGPAVLAMLSAVRQAPMA